MNFNETALISTYFENSGIASIGGKGGRVPPWQQKNCQKSGKRGEKIRKKEEKLGKIEKKRENQEERQKSGRFFHFAPPDK